MHFPTSGVEVLPIVPPLVAFAISTLVSPAGVSGAFLILPFQMSVLGFTSPAVSATNLLYNVIAIPGGVSQYIREGRMAWPIAWTTLAGTLPGITGEGNASAAKRACGCLFVPPPAQPAQRLPAQADRQLTHRNRAVRLAAA